MKNELPTDSPSWDLRILYGGEEDPRLLGDIAALEEGARAFASAWKGRMGRAADPGPLAFLSAIEEYDAIQDRAMILRVYAHLWRSCDTRDPGRIGLFQRVEEAWSRVRRIIAFFELDLKSLPLDLLEGLAARRDLARYRPFLLSQIRNRPHALTEPEEAILMGWRLSGRDAFLSLYDQMIGTLRIRTAIGAGEEILGIDQALSLAGSPYGLARRRASEALYRALEEKEVIFGNILNALILDYSLEDRLRGHPYPMHRVHLQNGLDRDMVEGMMEAVESRYYLARRYYRLKARALGLGTLKTCDLGAPLQGDTPRLSFSRARELFLRAMKGFHPVFYREAARLFHEGRIDAEPRMGKQAGAFCKYLTPSISPYVSLSYDGSPRALMTLAHEAGHAIQYRLLWDQACVNLAPRPVLEETAATFVELVLARHLAETGAFKGFGPVLAASRIEAMLTTAFRQNVITRFEQALHQKRRDYSLGPEEICGLWLEQNRILYGKDVEMTPGYAWDWARIPHIFHSPFYCYSYVSGNLLSIVLFQKYLEKGNGFLDLIINLLKTGYSRGPMEMIGEMGLNLADRSSWDPAFGYLEDLIDRLEGPKAALS